jgi:hypothetical protein
VAAHAQHVVTEAEASKLTLEALTAAPRPVYRPVYRAYYRPAMATRFEHARGHGWRHGFERASYRAVSYRTTVSHHAARHHRHF